MKKLKVPKKIEVKYHGDVNLDFEEALKMALSYSDLEYFGSQSDKDGVIVTFIRKQESELI